jgi:ribosomal protein S18 acetylase RimI-like enzyme
MQVHPDYCCTDLYGEMLAVAESELASVNYEGRKRVLAWSDSKNSVLQGILTERGYGRIEDPDSICRQGRQDLHRDMPLPVVPEGYEIRNMDRLEDIPSRSWCSWRAFHPDEPDEKYEGWAWYMNIHKAPLYKDELDVVAVIDDEIVGFCTVWHDPATETAYFEPVGVHPDHQRKGLGLACITEGLQRARALGCRRAFLGGSSAAAKALYAKAGFGEYDLSEPWIKYLD